MIQIRKYNPILTWSGERVAKCYARRLVGPGSAGALILLFPVNQLFGLLFGLAMMTIAYYRGKAYRGIEPELAQRASLARRLFLLAAAAKFLTVTTISGALRWARRTGRARWRQEQLHFTGSNQCRRFDHVPTMTDMNERDVFTTSLCPLVKVSVAQAVPL